jgi:L-lactate permease
MNTTLLLIGFSLAVLMGAGLASLLRTVKPDWSIRRRQLTAASVLPAITAAATLLGIVFIATTDHGESERMEDLAIAAVATIGGTFVVIALVGGLLGAMLSGRRHG